MPKYPIYVSLLSKEAQSEIGQVHEKTNPALRMLEKEGFSCRGYVDIFDAGPTLEANLKHVRTAQASCKLPIKIDDEKAALGQDVFAINTLVEGFRGASIRLLIDKEEQFVFISHQAAKTLTVSAGDAIRFAPSAFRA
jgi:arginine N-succinyltransferase